MTELQNTTGNLIPISVTETDASQGTRPSTISWCKAGFFIDIRKY
jgi:hypothetical protein